MIIDQETLWNQNCVLAMPLNSKNGSIVYDYHPLSTAHPTKHNGTITGTCAIRGGRDGRGLIYLNGSTDYISISQSSDLNFGSNNFTVILWLNSLAPTTAQQVLNNWGNSSYSWYLSLNTSGYFVFVIRISGTNYTLTGPSTAIGSIFRYICIVRNGNTFNLYLDGILGSIYTYSGTLESCDETFYVGCFRDQTSKFNGYIRDLFIMNGTALLQDAIVNIMQATDPR